MEEFLTPLSLLMPAFSLPRAPRKLAAIRFTARGTLSYRSVKDEAHSFGGWLEPRYIIRARALDQ